MGKGRPPLIEGERVKDYKFYLSQELVERLEARAGKRDRSEIVRKALELYFAQTA